MLSDIQNCLLSLHQLVSEVFFYLLRKYLQSGPLNEYKLAFKSSLLNEYKTKFLVFFTTNAKWHFKLSTKEAQADIKCYIFIECMPTIRGRFSAARLQLNRQLTPIIAKTKEQLSFICSRFKLFSCFSF